MGEPQWQNDCTFKRGDKAYTFLQGELDKAEVTYLDDGRMQDGRTVYYLYELKGGHTGEPFKVRMVGPDYEFNTDGGISYVWDKLIYDDDLNTVDDLIDDWYSTLLAEDLKEIVNETWD